MCIDRAIIALLICKNAPLKNQASYLCYAVNEHVESVFNAVLASAVIIPSG
ncbi:MAG: hypothetical protein OFPII_40470 [Osedax symbiont Rs1]|nr:MAG: hypothetical protein OFPII_40470 [Osedax symbiont Rs1]